MDIKELEFTPRGTCSRKIYVRLWGDTVEEVVFTGGCSGNTTGVAALVKGMKAEEAISRLEGIRCGAKNTSCPDQLAKAIRQCMSETPASAAFN